MNTRNYRGDILVGCAEGTILKIMMNMFFYLKTFNKWTER